METDPRSYRVPVVRLSQMHLDEPDEGGEPPQAPKETPTSPSPSLGLPSTPPSSPAVPAPTTPMIEEVAPPPPVQPSPEIVPAAAPANIAVVADELPLDIPLDHNPFAAMEVRGEVTAPPVAVTEVPEPIKTPELSIPSDDPQGPRDFAKPDEVVKDVSLKIGDDMPDMWDMPLAPPPAPAPAPTVPSPPPVVVVSSAPENPFTAPIPVVEEVSVPPQAPPPPLEPKGAKVSGMNLSALRERVLSESLGVTTPQPHTSESALGEPTANAASVYSTNQEQHALLSDTQEVGGRDMPETAHAHAIAEVAQALGATASSEILGKESPSAPTQAPGTVTLASSAPQTSGLPQMRTFRSDVASTMMRNQTSVVDMLSAEQNRLGSAENPVVRTASQSRLSSTSYILIGATVALLVGTLTVGALFYFTRPAEEAAATKNFFYPERTEMFDIAGKDRATLMRELVELREGVDVRVNFITEVKLVESVLLPTTNVTEVQAVTGERLLAALGTNAPATLTRALTPQTMLGIHEFGGNQPYLIFTTSDFENALSGMMRWEETLLEDLDPLFDTNQSGGTPETPPATSTAATSSASTTPARDMAISETFKDRTVGNIQVRAFEDGEGDIQLLWCMPDSATIIITTSTDTLTHVRKMMTAREY